MEFLQQRPSSGETKLNTLQLKQRKWVRAPRAGMFLPQLNNGAFVQKGAIIGKVADTHAKRSKPIKAPFSGYIFCINHQAVVNRGDALFHIGTEEVL